jgi:hypothetical protein
LQHLLRHKPDVYRRQYNPVVAGSRCSPSCLFGRHSANRLVALVIEPLPQPREGTRVLPFGLLSAYIFPMLWRVRNSRGRTRNAPAAFIQPCRPTVSQRPPPLTNVRGSQDRRFFFTLALTIVAFIILITPKARAQADVGGALTDHSHPGLGRPNSLRLPKPPIDPSGNIVHRNIEIVDTPTLIPGPRIDASLLLPASLLPASIKRRSSRWAWPTVSGPILIDIDVMQVFIPWEFRVAGAFER